jgi:hypothetical protein
MFQLASHVHPNLRLGLLIKEFRSRVDEPVRVVVGKPLPSHELASLRADPRALMAYLRQATYDLSPEPIKSYGYGYEFEEKYRAL